ncbi:hypothetical protein ACFLV7_09805 [Chloroflexota bacterium]
MPIVDTVRFTPQKTVDKIFGPLGFDEGYKSPDSEIMCVRVHILTARELGTFPTPPQTSLDAAVSLIAHFTSGTQAGCILAEITYQTAIRDTIYKCLSIHRMFLQATTRRRSCLDSDHSKRQMKPLAPSLDGL